MPPVSNEDAVKVCGFLTSENSQLYKSDSKETLFGKSKETWKENTDKVHD